MFDPFDEVETQRLMTMGDVPPEATAGAR
jgi:hypothetical protein